MKYWPFGIVWSRTYGWLEVQDPWTGQWFEIPKNDAPRGWKRIAMDSRDPRKNKSYKGVRIDELDAARRLPGYAD